MINIIIIVQLNNTKIVRCDPEMIFSQNQFSKINNNNKMFKMEKKDQYQIKHQSQIISKTNNKNQKKVKN